MINHADGDIYISVYATLRVNWTEDYRELLGELPRTSMSLFS